MSTFFEVEFPRTISYKGVGGSGFNTTVNEGLSGFEQRNKNWSTARGQWQISLITPAAFAGNRQSFTDLLNAFFLNVGGMSDGFRLFDFLDNRGVGQIIGIGDSTTRSFQLLKVYTIGARTYTRVISKPITSAVSDYKGNALGNTVVVYVNGVQQATNTYTVDAATGIVLFNAGHAPAALAVVSADFQFHYPVRFDADQIQLSVEESDIKDGQPIIAWANIGLKEIRVISGQSQG